MSGPNGISAVARADLARAAGDRTVRPAVTLYGLSDGVEATLIHGGVASAGAVTTNGEVWFPSNRGPVRIAPVEARPESVPKVAIEDVLVDGREVDFRDRLIVPPGEGKLQINYSAVRLRSQERLRFRYRLESFDREWNDASRRRVAYYTNLPPGEYRFRVQAFDLNMPDRVTEASLAIEWKTRFYRRAWFLVLVVGLAAASVLAAWRLRLREVHSRFRAVLEERNRVAREMHDTVIQGCAGVSALLEAVVSIGGDAAGTKGELLDAARSQVRATVDEARRAVWNLRQNGAPGDITVQIEQMAKQASQASHVPVRIERSGEKALLDPAVEHDILMVAREAVHNALRHGRPSEVRICVHFSGERLEMRVNDNGRGFSPAEAESEPAERFGLLGMRERTERLGGRFQIRSAPGAGTELFVEVPARSAAAERLRMDWK
jgi:signal transduction histidine kinase